MFPPASFIQCFFYCGLQKFLFNFFIWYSVLSCTVLHSMKEFLLK
jgi:hypothetical protein